MRGSPSCSSPPPLPPSIAAAKEASDTVVAMLGALVEAKQSDPGDDLVSDLINARDGEERLDSQELLSTIFQLIVAGHDTTASLIGNSLVALFRNPASWPSSAPIPPRSQGPWRSSSASTHRSLTRHFDTPWRR